MAHAHPNPPSRNTLRLAAAVTLTLIGALTAHAAVQYFNDVPSDHWAANAINWAANAGVMSGPANMPGNFDPNGTVNRAQLATVLSREDANLRAVISVLQQRIAVLEARLNISPASSSSSVWSSSSSSVSSVASSSTSSVTAWTETDSTWRDIDQGLMKIEDGKLYRSTNNGSTWLQLRPMQWQADGGLWYRFDDKLNLNTSSDGLRWTSVPNRQWTAYGVVYWIDYSNKVWKSM